VLVPYEPHQRDVAVRVYQWTREHWAPVDGTEPPPVVVPRRYPPGCPLDDPSDAETLIPGTAILPPPTRRQR
jgi:hypothetical protein